MLELHDSAKKTLKGYVEAEARKENQEEDVDLTPHEHERALKRSYRSFVMPGKPKIDIDSYFDQAKPHIKTLIENQRKEMGSAKIIMTLWVIWKKPIKLLIDPEDFKDAVDKGRLAHLVSPSPRKWMSLKKKEMKKSRFLVKNKLSDRYGRLVDHIPKPIKNAAGKALRAKNSILGLYDGVKKTLKDDVENQKQAKDNTNLATHENEEDIYYEKIEMPFNSLMTEFFDASDINDLIERMLAYIKSQTENPKFPESGFTLIKIMHLYINFHRLALTRGGSYIKLPKWIKSKKTVINTSTKQG